MEYAMCFQCREKLSGELSRESLQRIEAHFEERVVLEDRMHLMLNEASDDVGQWIDDRERCDPTVRESRRVRERRHLGRDTREAHHVLHAVRVHLLPPAADVRLGVGLGDRESGGISRCHWRFLGVSHQ